MARPLPGRKASSWELGKRPACALARRFTLSQNGYGARTPAPLADWPEPQARAAETKKASSTQGCSRTVPQSSTDRALRRLTAEFERDPVYSTRYGRQRNLRFVAASSNWSNSSYF